MSALIVALVPGRVAAARPPLAAARHRSLRPRTVRTDAHRLARYSLARAAGARLEPSRSLRSGVDLTPIAALDVCRTAPTRPDTGGHVSNSLAPDHCADVGKMGGGRAGSRQELAGMMPPLVAGVESWHRS